MNKKKHFKQPKASSSWKICHVCAAEIRSIYLFLQCTLSQITLQTLCEIKSVYSREPFGERSWPCGSGTAHKGEIYNQRTEESSSCSCFLSLSVFFPRLEKPEVSIFEKRIFTSREVLSLMWRAPGPRLTRRLVVSSPRPLVTLGADQHMSSSSDSAILNQPNRLDFTPTEH